MSSGMNKAQAEEYAKTMTYKQAINNIWAGKGIMYRKATMIKLHELAVIADKLVLCKDCEASRVYGKTTQWLACESVMEEQTTDLNRYCYLGERKIMSDLISRKDALKPFCTAPDGTPIPEVDCDNFPVEFSVEFIKKHLLSLPSAEPKTGEWIPCSERLPKAEDMYQPPEQRYLCQLEAYGVRKFCVLSRLKGAVSPFWDWYGVAVHDSDVTAWMPLPKPYREDGEA